ncbi:MAG: hemerythrin domain-containing protein [Rhodobacteraceae bacterium]|jgi:iron-sulfur cluster repair protein YtfE (RIC family)|nr:hemerythrin domain-containing protein [Paracoccaceae bacterium]
MTTPFSLDALRLADRAGLPEALRVLLDDYPRDGWATHPQFEGLVAFWLQRHQMFRDLMGLIATDAEAAMDRRLGGRAYAARLSQLGGGLVQNLHGHHQIEDHHYFPVLRRHDARIAIGFDLLDADHHAMDGLLSGFAEAANAAIRAAEDPGALVDRAADLRACMADFRRMLARHLDDEEDLIVPVILRSGGAGLD